MTIKKPTTARCIEWLDLDPIALSLDDKETSFADDQVITQTIRAKLIAAEEMAKALEHLRELGGHINSLVMVDVCDKPLAAWRKAGGQ